MVRESMAARIAQSCDRLCGATRNRLSTSGVVSIAWISRYESNSSTRPRTAISRGITCASMRVTRSLPLGHLITPFELAFRTTFWPEPGCRGIATIRSARQTQRHVQKIIYLTYSCQYDYRNLSIVSQNLDRKSV